MVRYSRYFLTKSVNTCFANCSVQCFQYLFIVYLVIGVGGSGAAGNGINLNAISTIGKNAAKGVILSNFLHDIVNHYTALN